MTNFNVSLEILKVDSYGLSLKIFSLKNFSIYWNKTYEPNYLKIEEYLKKNFKNNNINFNIFKGHTLNEIDEIKKNDGTPFRVFTPFWRNAEKFYFEKIPKKEKKISRCIKKRSFFENTIHESEIYPKKKWYKKFEKYWEPSEDVH